MVPLYHNLKKTEKPRQESEKLVIEQVVERTVEQELFHRSSREMNLYKYRINNCEKSLSALQEYLNSGGYSSSLSNSVLSAEKSFTNMKDFLTKSGYSLNNFSNGMYIESNLNTLSDILKSYEKRLEYNPSARNKALVAGGFATVGGLLGMAGSSSDGFGFGPLAGFLLGAVFLGGIGIVVASAVVDENPSPPPYKGNHREPIRNIIQYSNVFFDDLRNKIK
jgi:hypothetical protein